MLSNEIIKQKLTEKFPDQIFDWQDQYGMLTFTAANEINLKVLLRTAIFVPETKNLTDLLRDFKKNRNHLVTPLLSWGLSHCRFILGTCVATLAWPKLSMAARRLCARQRRRRLSSVDLPPLACGVM